MDRNVTLGSDYRAATSRCSAMGRALVLLGVLGVSLLGGCETGGQGAVTGASVGALSGLAIGSMSGNAGRGAAIGAIGGGATGAVIGDQNRRNTQARNEQNARQAAPAPVPITAAPPANTAGMTNADRDRLALAKFARNWRVNGWETIDGQRRPVSGTGVGVVENAFFLRLDMQVTDQQTGQINRGNVVLAADPGRGLTLNSRFDTSPSPAAYAGSVSADGMTFTLDEIGGGRRITMRFLSLDEFVAEVTGGAGVSGLSASFNFSAIR